jgi:hypothetical protein
MYTEISCFRRKMYFPAYLVIHRQLITPVWLSIMLLIVVPIIVIVGWGACLRLPIILLVVISIIVGWDTSLKWLFTIDHPITIATA